jgi:hypothetical protein
MGVPFMFVSPLPTRLNVAHENYAVKRIREILFADERIRVYYSFQGEAMTKEDLLIKLQRMTKGHGSKVALARSLEVSPQFLGDLLAGRRDPGEKMLTALGLRKVVSYHPVKSARTMEKAS